MKIFKVTIYLKNEDSPEVGWLVGKTAVEVANRIQQPTVILASSCIQLEEAGYNMSEVQEIDGYNSSEIVTYHVKEYGVIPCNIK